NFFVQMLDGVRNFFDFDQRLALGIFTARLRQLTRFLEPRGVGRHRFDLRFQLFFLGLAQIGCSYSATQAEDRENRDCSHISGPSGEFWSLWRTHSCVPRRHSWRRLAIAAGVEMSLDTA